MGPRSKQDTDQSYITVQKMVSTKFTDLPGALEGLAGQYALALSQKNLDDLAKGLSILSTRAGTLLLTGHATAFPDLTVQQREACLQSWSTSRLALLRSIFRGVVGESLASCSAGRASADVSHHSRRPVQGLH